MLRLFFKERNPEVNFIFKQTNETQTKTKTLQILVTEAGEKVNLCKYIKKSIFTMLWPGSAKETEYKGNWRQLSPLKSTKISIPFV